MKNIFKTFVAGAFIVLISAGVITFVVGAVKGFASIASATGWVVVLCDECLHAEDNKAQKCDWCVNGCWRENK